MQLYKTPWTTPVKFLLVKIFKRRSLWFFLLIANLFLASCSKSSVQPVLPSKEAILFPKGEERAWMEKFFKEFFLEGTSIYTLFGSKPISAEMLVFATEEDCRKSVLLYLEKEGIDEKEGEKILSEALEDFRKDDFLKNWNKWILFFEQYPNPPFLFAKHPTLSDKFWSGHILNVQEAIWTLQKYYDIFKTQLGYDFDPVSVTMDFKNEKSEFWKQVFSNHFLTGIVYGYGYKNSYFFNLKMKFENNREIEGPRLSSQSMSTMSFRYSLDNLSLPKFRSFETPFNNDPVLEKYKLERKKIMSKLSDSNFFEMVFLQLTGELSNEDKISKRSLGCGPEHRTSES